VINEAGIDYVTIEDLRTLGGDRLVAEVVTTYLDEARGDIDALREATRAADPVLVEEIAHRLKSASAGVGATTVASHAEELQFLGRAGSVSAAPEIVRALDDAWQQVETELTPLARAA